MRTTDGSAHAARPLPTRGAHPLPYREHPIQRILPAHPPAPSGAESPDAETKDHGGRTQRRGTLHRGART